MDQEISKHSITQLSLRELQLINLHFLLRFKPISEASLQERESEQCNITLEWETLIITNNNRIMTTPKFKKSEKNLVNLTMTKRQITVTIQLITGHLLSLKTTPDTTVSGFKAKI